MLNSVLQLPRRFLLHISRPLVRWGLLDRLSDVTWIKLNFWLRNGRLPDLNDPKTFGEKEQWLKLHFRPDICTTMVDKFEAKKYVASRIGEEYTVPTLGVWDSADDIDFDALPERFVLKCTHDSGRVIVCTDKSRLDIPATRKKLREYLAFDYYLRGGREWPYKNVKRRIIAEEYLCDSATGELRDYKFFAFDGQVRMMYIASGRSGGKASTRCDYFDNDFTHQDIRLSYRCSETPVAKPQNFERMKELAAKLSAGFPHVRVDFYEVDGRVYFGEFTFYTTGGMTPFKPDKWNRIFGDWITLPEKGKLS